MFLPDQNVNLGIAPPRRIDAALSATALPSGIRAFIGVLRLRAAVAAGIPMTATMLANIFDHFNWPDGEVVLDDLIAAHFKASGRALEVRPYRCPCLSGDEQRLVRAAAMLDLGFAGRTCHELSTALGTSDVEPVIRALTDFVTELRLAGLSFAMTHIPSLPCGIGYPR